jgi:hypothetical protein
MPADRERCAVAAERHDPLSPPLHAVDQLQPVDAVVIVGARFDLPLPRAASPVDRRPAGRCGLRADDRRARGRKYSDRRRSCDRRCRSDAAIGIVRRHDQITGERAVRRRGERTRLSPPRASSADATCAVASRGCTTHCTRVPWARRRRRRRSRIAVAVSRSWELIRQVDAADSRRLQQRDLKSGDVRPAARWVQ